MNNITRRGAIGGALAATAVAATGGTAIAGAPTFGEKTFIRIGTAGSGGNTYRVVPAWQRSSTRNSPT